jgi:heme-degrading monooxygenase HmoA
MVASEANLTFRSETTAYQNNSAIWPGLEETTMPVKVFIRRKIKAGQLEKAFEILKRFRSGAMKQPGYVSGETLVDHYDSRNITIISSWETVDDWIRWQESEAREINESELEDYLEAPTKYEICDVGKMS